VRALVTGATGFLGSHLARRLRDTGHEVHAVVRRSSDPAHIEALGDGITLHLHDGSSAGMHALVGAAKPEIVFHLACLAISEHAPDQIDDLVRSNVLLPTQLFEALAAHGIERLVNVGSALQHFESAAYEPTCLYAALKQAVEDILRFYVASAGLSVVTLKFFHVYGSDDPRPRLVPLLARAARTRQALDMTGGDQIVDLVHVDDATDALLRAAEMLERGEVSGQHAYAVSSGAACRVRHLVDVLAGANGAPPPVRFGAKPYKRREILEPISTGPPLPGWKPRVSLDEGIRRVLANSDFPEE
jgi:nucleoside-diphosphate-sugar epimerase